MNYSLEYGWTAGNHNTDLMSPERAIDALMLVPYGAGCRTWARADCFGIIELWYQHVLGVTVTDRADHAAGHDGMQAGFECATAWQKIDEPADHCLVIMRHGQLVAGHVGVFFGGSVLHSDESHGCVYEPIGDRFVRSRITSFLERK